VIVLVIFNWRFIHFAREQADASIEQARTAKESLDKLKEQIDSEVAMRSHAAIAVIREAIRNVEFWIGGARYRTEFRSEPVQLIPDDWNLLTAYVSRHLPRLSLELNSASTGLRNIESSLSTAIAIPINQRRPPSSVQVHFDSLSTNLDIMRKSLIEISNALKPELMHSGSGQNP
jgi:hypothetical protein